MSDETTLESVLKALDENSQAAITAAFEKIKSDAQEQINTVRSDLDSKLAAANKRAEELEWEMAGNARDTSSTTELTPAQRRIQERREREAAEAARAAELEVKEKEIAALREANLGFLRESAKSAGVPEDILTRCSTPEAIETAILQHKHYGNGQTGSNGVAAGPRPGTTTPGSPSGTLAPTDAVTALEQTLKDAW